MDCAGLFCVHTDDIAACLDEVTCEMQLYPQLAQFFVQFGTSCDAALLDSSHAPHSMSGKTYGYSLVRLRA